MASTSEIRDIPDKPEEKLSDVFDSAMNYYHEVEQSKEATNSPTTQSNVQKSMRLFEQATCLVSHSAVFSSNESVEELTTDSLQYLLLPALLGVLSLKLTNQPRKDVVHVAEIYFRDFLQRCKDYGITEVTAPQPSDTENDSKVQKIKATQSEQSRLVAMVMNREEKLKRYKEQKELQAELKALKAAMDSPSWDEQTKREYFIALIKSYVNQSLDELNSIDAEKSLLDFMEQMKAGGLEEEAKKPKRPPAPLKPFIITKDDIQKAVYGFGYPSLPVLTVEEFYEQRVKEGSFPAPQTKLGISSLQETTERDMEQVKDDEDEAKENQVENDDDELLQRARNMDEYKDDHKRGWGNRHNRS